MAFLLKLILGLVGITVVAAGVIAVLLVTGKPEECGPGRSVSVSPAVGQQVESSLHALYDGSGGTLALDESDATSLATRHAGGLIRDLKVCFEEGTWQASGAISGGDLAEAGVPLAGLLDVGGDIQVWMSGGLAFSGSSPVATGLTIKLGGVPEFIGGMAESFVRSYVNERLAQANVSRPTSVQFSRASATVTVR